MCRRKKRVPNVTNLVTSSMPKGRGRKGGIPPHTRTKQVPNSRVSMCIENKETISACVANSTSCCVTEVMPTNSVISTHGDQQNVNICIFPAGFPSTLPSPGPYYPPCSFPPHFPYSPYSPGPPNSFSHCFISGNISVCMGCKNRYSKPAQPPDDLVIKHQEWRQFTTEARVQSKYGNIYYHCNPQCVWLRYPEFVPSQVDTTAVMQHLNSTHKAHLLHVFGLNLP